MTDKEKARLEFAKTHIEMRPYHNIHSSVFMHHTVVLGYDGFGFARDVY
jgi:hypothetical protein